MKCFNLKSKLLVFTAVTTLMTFGFLSLTDAFEDVEFVQEMNAGFQDPVDVVVSDEGPIYVLDRRLSQVMVYDETGYYLRSFGSKGSGPGEFSRPQSIVLTPQGDVLVADTGNNRIQAFSPDGTFLFSFGSSGRLRGEFQSPTAVATDSNGFIYVSDARNRRLQIFSPHGVYLSRVPFEDEPQDVAIDVQNRVYVLRPDAGVVTVISDGQSRNVSFNIGSKNYVASATAIAVDSKGSILITENLEHSIKKFTKEDGLLLAFGSEGKSRGQFKEPAGIFMDQNDKIYVVDSRNKRIQILKNTGSTKEDLVAKKKPVPMVDYLKEVPTDLGVSDLQVNPYGDVLTLSERNNYFVIHSGVKKVIGTSGRDNGEFSRPQAFVYGADDRIYVADSGNNRVQIFDYEGKFQYAFGERGSKTGQLSAPRGIAVNSNGLIYVADTQNDRVQIFNKDGIFMMAFGQRSESRKDDVPADGTFDEPTALAVDHLDRLYVVDSQNNRIQVFDEKGKHLESFGRLGEQYGEFDGIVDIAVDHEGYIYVAEKNNQRIQIFSPQAKSKLIFGSAGAGYSEFEELSAVDVYDDKIYVADARNEGIRVYIFEKNFVQKKRKPMVKPQIPKEEKEDDEEEFELK